jgi:diaminopimelate epimerase
MGLRHIPFKKMNGLGNDFVIIDARAAPIRLSASLAGQIANRTIGAGCDQVIVLESSGSADVFMRILNADGSEVGACGNASRCVATLLGPALGRDQLTIQTAAGILNASIADSGLVTVDMGPPRFAWNEIPLARAFPDTRAIELTYPLPDGRVLESPSAVNVGNPHCIFWVAEVESYDLASFGATLENNELFPERANISLAEIVANGTVGDLAAEIKLRVWERGAGITRACGTAACATAVAAARKGLTGRHVNVQLPGGVLSIEWRAEDDHILMTGPTEFEFEGILHVNGDSVAVEAARHS